MSGLFSALNNSVRAITAHSRAIETAGKNLANVDNAGYARQRVVYGEQSTYEGSNGIVQGSGVEALGVQQLRNQLLDRQLAREISLQGRFDAQQDLLGRAETGLGQSIARSQATAGAAATSSVGGLAAAVDNFFNAFQGLAARPTDQGTKQTLLQNAATLVERLRTTDGRMAQLEQDVGTQIESDITGANRLLTSIATLNSQIARAEAGSPGSAVDLRDQRQARIEELAANLDFEVRDGANGQVSVVAKDVSNTEVVLVDGATVTGPLSFDGTGVKGGAAAASLALPSGSIAGALEVRDQALRPLRSDLDALARQLVVSVNATYTPGAGSDFFDPAGLTAASISLSSSLSSATLRAGSGAASDNSLAQAVADLATRSFSVSGGDSIDGTFSEHYARAVSGLGEKVAAAQSNASDQESITRYVRSQRDGVSGVSLDEEMADLVKFQRAFQASSRVFTIVDELLDSVVNQMGR